MEFSPLPTPPGVRTPRTSFRFAPGLTCVRMESFRPAVWALLRTSLPERELLGPIRGGCRHVLGPLRPPTSRSLRYPSIPGSRPVDPEKTEASSRPASILLRHFFGRVENRSGGLFGENRRTLIGIGCRFRKSGPEVRGRPGGGSAQNRGRPRRGGTGSRVASSERQSDAESDSAKTSKLSRRGGK